jgi:adenylyltransferase/sulfurtransferase
MELSNDELNRYSRQIVLDEVGYTGQVKLKNARVYIVGVGGLGCPIATQLAAMGVGFLRLIDHDVVERSNLHRQHLFDVNYVGYPKVEAAAKKLRALNPDVTVEPIPMSLSGANARELLQGADVVVDGLDSIETRYTVNRACVELNIPYIYGGALTTYGAVSTIIPGKTGCLECFNAGLTDDALPTCAVMGVHPSLLGIVASLQTAEAVRIIIGERPVLANKLLLVDLSAMSIEAIQLTPQERCPVCGSSPHGSPTPLERTFVDETCGRDGKRTFVLVPRENLDLDLHALVTLLEQRNATVHVAAELGVTFTMDTVVASVLRSGVMINKGSANSELAQRFYADILVNGLHIPWARIRGPVVTQTDTLFYNDEHNDVIV